MASHHKQLSIFNVHLYQSNTLKNVPEMTILKSDDFLKHSVLILQVTSLLQT